MEQIKCREEINAEVFTAFLSGVAENVFDEVEKIPALFFADVKRVIVVGAGACHNAAVACKKCFLDSAKLGRSNYQFLCPSQVETASPNAGDTLTIEIAEENGGAHCGVISLAKAGTRWENHMMEEDSAKGFYSVYLLLAAVACRLSGQVPHRALLPHLVHYGEQYDRALMEMNQAVAAFADANQPTVGCELIADDALLGCACKMADALSQKGIFASAGDSEDWCHINFGVLETDDVPLIALAQKDEPNRSRVGETIFQAAGIGRPVLLIADGTRENYALPEGIAICRLPDFDEASASFAPLFEAAAGELLTQRWGTALSDRQGGEQHS